MVETWPESELAGESGRCTTFFDFGPGRYLGAGASSTLRFDFGPGLYFTGLGLRLGVDLSLARSSMIGFFLDLGPALGVVTCEEENV